MLPEYAGSNALNMSGWEAGVHLFENQFEAFCCLPPSPGWREKLNLSVMFGVLVKNTFPSSRVFASYLFHNWPFVFF